MNNRTLIITYKPDILTMVKHKGSKDNYIGKVSRAERECIKNIKTIEAAIKVVKKRNSDSILHAKYNNIPIQLILVKTVGEKRNISIHVDKEGMRMFDKALKERI